MLFIIEMNALQEARSICWATTLESSKRGKCCAGPVGGGGMPWIRKQNTRCQRGSDAIKSNEKVSERKAMRACGPALTACLEREQMLRAFRSTWGGTQCSRAIYVHIDHVEILSEEFLATS